MSEEVKPPSKLGTIGWFDLTVADAGAIKDFYSAVVGWKATETPVSDYADYTMEAPRGPVSGICHARGANANLPPVWLIYLHVADLDDSLASVRQLGGEVISGPTDYGPSGRFAIIRDPAGAHCALYQASA